MAGKFGHEDLSCQECGKACLTEDAESGPARYTLKRNLCTNCALGKCADSILSAMNPTRCSEHRHRDVILFCVKCKKPICDVCTFLTHSGHAIQDLNRAVEERRSKAKNHHAKIVEKSRELGCDRRQIEECADSVTERFERLRYAVLVRVEEKSRSLDDDLCIQERRIEHRAKDEKLKIDRWKDNRLKEAKDDKNAKCRAIRQRQCALLEELEAVKQKLLGQLEEIREQLDSADEVIAESKEAAERTLAQSVDELLQSDENPEAPNARLEDCLGLELDEESLAAVKDIAASVRFEPESSEPVDGQACLLGRFVTTAPAWCKKHTIQVGLPKFRLLKATNDADRVTFTGENDDDRYGLYTLDVATGNTNLVSSDALWVTDTSMIDRDLIAVSRNERSAIEVWSTKTGKVKKHIKIPRSWTNTCLTVDREGQIIARGHANSHGKLAVYRADNGEKVRSVPYSGTVFNLQALSTGDLVIQSAATEIVIIDRLGALRAKLRRSSWQWVRCAVGHDDTVVVAYGRKDDATSIHIDSYSSTGEFIEHLTKHRCTPSLDHLAVVVTKSGQIVLQNGGDLVIFDRLIPLVPVSTSSSSRTVSESSSSPPRSPTRRTIFMCIPTS